ncbi:MAG: hypothetical protein ACQEQS_03020 [Thermodesulfobacteriota bacterium]
MFDGISDTSHIDPMKREHFFFERLKLLMVMCEAFINGYPVEDFRKDAVLNNAEHVFFEITDWDGKYLNLREKAGRIHGIQPDNFFFQRVKLLALMAKSFAQGNPVGYFRARAVKDTILEIEEMFHMQKTDISELNVFNVA